MTSPDVYLSLGSNIAPEENLQAAVDLLRDQCEVLAISPVYQSPPYGNPDQADFLDVVVKIKTDKTPLEFKVNVLRQIEKTLGRIRSPENKFGPLTLDMDVLLWGDLVLDYGQKPWHIPNKGLVEFAADALPMVDLAPELIHPETGETMRDLVVRLDQTGIIKTEIIIT
ncbi:MAG: 2-amino-4-hydroxy-6-hydroxymethyldihydropteridine diphosphokinase [Aggregatilineales bacterium]